MVVLRQCDFLPDAFLCVGYRAAEIASLDVVLYRDIALVALAVDKGSAGIKGYISEFT